MNDTAAVAVSAAALGMEIGSKLARKTLNEVSRKGPATPPAPASPPSASAEPHVTGAPATPEATEKDINVRAYLLWEQAGRPEGRDKEFYFQAEQEL